MPDAPTDGGIRKWKKKRRCRRDGVRVHGESFWKNKKRQTGTWHNNNVFMTSKRHRDVIWRHNDVIIALSVHWETTVVLVQYFVCLIYIMGFPIQVRLHLYIETIPRPKDTRDTFYLFMPYQLQKELHGANKFFSVRLPERQLENYPIWWYFHSSLSLVRGQSNLCLGEDGFSCQFVRQTIFLKVLF